MRTVRSPLGSARTLLALTVTTSIALHEVAVWKPAWWYFVPALRGTAPEGELTPIWTADRLDERLADESDVHRSDGLVWLYSEEPCAVWLRSARSVVRSPRRRMRGVDGDESR